ncbi:unnamed protein product [Soboliphyme baturini]|uniref:Animal hem peroxidase n=1 Tax=Soboliphyme baturini TaxID=241478 RepID=A0A183J743_9BILA|nr:unnamed protein product [Soboliphyme baturini]
MVYSLVRPDYYGLSDHSFHQGETSGRANAREASRFLLSSPQLVTKSRWNMMLMQFGQFLTHDVTRTSLLPTDRCGNCNEISGRCLPIRVENNDPRFGCRSPQCCLFFTRSSPLCGTGITQARMQVNENTAFIDGSAIYSSSLQDSARLREPGSGRMRFTFFNNHIMPPFNPQTCANPQNCNANFDVGDNRASIFNALVGMHALMIREHNRIATALGQLNPRWSPDRIFQETRKIIGAEIQVITSKEWLPKIIGNSYDTIYGRYRHYDPSVDPSIFNEFATAAMRFGHGMITEFYEKRTDNGHVPQGKVRYSSPSFSTCIQQHINYACIKT